MDLLGWKVEQLSNDYKFCALTEEGELERFIEEHTLPEYSEYILLLHYMSDILHYIICIGLLYFTLYYMNDVLYYIIWMIYYIILYK